MCYIVVEIQKNSDGTIGNNVFAYDTLNEAESKYHNILSYAAKSPLSCHSAILFTEESFPVEYKCFKH